jgi:inhibitor of cysteine peptidase
MTTTALTEAAHGRAVHLAVGDTLSLRLAENPSTGYRWQLTLGTGLEAAGDDYAPGLPATAGVVGAAGERHFSIRATQAGDSTVSAVLRRGWDAAAAPARRFEISVQVR